MTRAVRSEPPALPPGAPVGPGYQVLAHLCRTRWLDLYDAWSAERDCRCVVKVLRPDRRDEPKLRDRLLREGRWLREFTHPHLVRAYETAEEPEPRVVLETLTGETLGHLIHRSRHRMAANDLAFLGLHLCSAMHYLHGQGLLHLDLKPSNVVVECRRAKVLDLSIARPPGRGRPGVGTLGYLAPEQARGGLLTPATDVWGIGATLFEAAIGEVPFDTAEAGSPSGTYGYASGTYGSEEGEPEDDWYPQLAERAPRVRSRRHLPEGLAAAIDACLAPEPEDRPALPALTAALDALLPRHRRDLRPLPD